MKVLIVEDEEILYRVLQEKLESEKHNVKVAIDGELALEMVKSFKPDFILLDIILPKKDGLSVLAELKASEEFSSIPVIVLSNLAEDDKIKEALKLGALDYFVKTQHPLAEIVEKIEESLLKAK
jgi:DNA-binding response OmpR family regulator